MVGGAERQPGEVWDRDPEEGDRSAERGDGAGQQRRRRDRDRSGADQMDAHRVGVVLAEEHRVERPDQRRGQHDTDEHGGHENPQIRPRRARVRAEAPQDELLHLGGLRERDQQRDDRAGDGPHHDADDEQRDDRTDPARDGEHEQQHGQRAYRGSRSDSETPGSRDRREDAGAGTRAEHHERDAQTRAGGHPEDVRVGEGIGEQRLHQQTRHRERRTRTGRGDHAGQTDVRDERGPAL